MVELFVSVFLSAASASPGVSQPMVLTEQKLCRGTQMVVVGTVGSYSQLGTKPHLGGAVFTVRRLTVDSVVFGAPPPEIEFRIPGDFQNDVVRTAGVPDWSTGTRHLMFVRHVPASDRWPETWMRLLDVVVPEGVALPSLQVMKEVFAEHCSEHRSDVASVSTNHTQQIMAELGITEIQTCEHY